MVRNLPYFLALAGLCLTKLTSSVRGKGEEAAPRLARESYCKLVKLASRQWPADGLALVTARHDSGVLPLQDGAKLPWESISYFPGEKWNGKVIWYFHGICGNGDFTVANNSTGTLDIYQGFSSGKPIVVGISLGEDWLLNSELRSGVWSIMQQLQKTYKLSAAGNWLFGFSMGGFNVLTSKARFYYVGVRALAGVETRVVQCFVLCKIGDIDNLSRSLFNRVTSFTIPY